MYIIIMKKKKKGEKAVWVLIITKAYKNELVKYYISSKET